MKEIQEYQGKTYTLTTLGLNHELPLCQVEDSLWIVVNEPRCFGCDVEFTRKASEALAEKISETSPEVILTPEAKSIGLAYETSRLLGLKHFVLARKSFKLSQGKPITSEVKSITTPEPQTLFLSDYDAAYLKNRRVALLDDVVSTGSTVLGMKDLLEKASGTLAVIASVWIEGPWVYDRFSEEMADGRFKFLDVLPLFAEGEKYRELIQMRNSQP